MVTKVHHNKCDARHHDSIDRQLIMPRNKSTSPRKQLTMPQVANPPQAASALDVKTRVLAALEDERYDWRTLNGLGRSVGAREEDILSVLNSMPDQVVRATSADGRTVFTTRNHYEKTHGFGDKILSVLTDKIVA
jgi:hypothetical protein